MEFEAQAAVICGLIVTLLMLDFETLKKRVGKLTHHASFRSVNLWKGRFLKKSYIMNQVLRNPHFSENFQISSLGTWKSTFLVYFFI
jgi:hypothetical protein